MESDIKLILTIVNSGFSERAMDAAREHGAGGGTVLRGRGTTADVNNIFGIKVDPEKDILLIVAPKDHCQAIMEAINKAAGLTTPAGGVCFVLPVDRVVGVNLK